jgi:nicotinamidase-related amidase
MPDILIEPKDCALVLVDEETGLAFGVESIDRQMLLNNVIALARTATAFGMPIVAVHVRHQGLQQSPDARDSRDFRSGHDRPPQHEHVGG